MTSIRYLALVAVLTVCLVLPAAAPAQQPVETSGGATEAYSPVRPLSGRPADPRLAPAPASSYRERAYPEDLSPEVSKCRRNILLGAGVGALVVHFPLLVYVGVDVPPGWKVTLGAAVIGGAVGWVATPGRCRL